ncbi:MAG TPA: hypothetical protein VHA52_00970, partial [Candidatus Babeliaceae bacterium]|nr:hypothetical protein [Candidatus Babeliaceae bacterium]
PFYSPYGYLLLLVYPRYGVAHESVQDFVGTIAGRVNLIINSLSEPLFAVRDIPSECSYCSGGWRTSISIRRISIWGQSITFSAIRSVCFPTCRTREKGVHPLAFSDMARYWIRYRSRSAF